MSAIDMRRPASRLSGSADGRFVLSVVESRRDTGGDLDREGASLYETYLFALRNAHPDYDDAALSHARNLKSAADSLRCAGRVPVICRWKGQSA